MFWIWLSTIVILIGGELNAETEHQTVCDTTTGMPKPMGARGATMADKQGRIDCLPFAHLRMVRVALVRPPSSNGSRRAVSPDTCLLALGRWVSTLVIARRLCEARFVRWRWLISER